jgi:hypothetical protein
LAKQAKAKKTTKAAKKPSRRSPRQRQAEPAAASIKVDETLEIDETIKVDKEPEENLPAPTARRPLMNYEEGCRRIALAASIDEVQELSAKAEALIAYAKQTKDTKLLADWATIQNRAEYRMGEVIIAMRNEGTLALSGGRRQPHQRTLADFDIPPKVGARAIQLTERYAPAEFVAKVEEFREKIASGNYARSLRLSARLEEDAAIEPSTLPEMITAAARWWSNFSESRKVEDLKDIAAHCSEEEVDQALINRLIGTLEDATSTLQRLIENLANRQGDPQYSD